MRIAVASVKRAQGCCWGRRDRLSTRSQRRSLMAMQSAALLFRGWRHGCRRAGLEQRMLRRSIARHGGHLIDGARAAR